MLLFNSLRSAMDLRDISGLIIVNKGGPHSDLFTFLNIP